ncbi:DUF421 domain-containing protein [Pigmentiphaga litoralis]|uniref:Uncharacterized membrane protein YcaP (DUF421 family) n=1 Tax=Pigmentiphaga litoralis TaxID=516702 RepID=A0A7Y9LMT5_9BURK|nr:YetF domain-containing protein [Pigmentiphaga litoralis]NYE22413.1 uncharacterized membrane protein YcaP (DUF421 family) [Pigmentiphaga litoralis]NYE83972.1 uncharacterized membrane protein YcaP (DUF421 family) [Pigmentiphaga litoralis]
MPEFQLTDIHRILFGNAPPTFLIEVAIRTALTYVLLVVVMRLLGRRVAAQFTLFEISLVITLAAAIGVPLQSGDRGLLPPLIIAAVVIVLQRLVMRIGLRHRRIEMAISTDVAPLVREGELLIDGMAKTVVGRNKLFELLRLQGFQHLGQISRAFLEPSGSLSVVPAEACRPGLSVLPEFDTPLLHEARVDGQWACGCCGRLIASDPAPVSDCPSCHQHTWTPAVLELKA